MVKIIDVRSLDNSKHQSNNFSPKAVAVEEKEENKEIRLSLFCEKTTLHGWKYFYSEPSKLPKFVWLFAIIGISFWVEKGFLMVMEGGQLERIIGRFVNSGIEVKDDERKLAAKASGISLK